MQRKPQRKEVKSMEVVQENVQQPEHPTIVRIDGVRFGDEDMADRVKFTTTEVVGEYAGTVISFWANMKNKDGMLDPNMKLFAILESAHGEGWTKKFPSLEVAIQALRGKYIAGDSVPKDRSKGGVGNNL